MKITNNKKIVNNDIQINKKVVSKFGKKTAYSSSSWSNSPRYIGFETLHQFLEGNNNHFSSKLQDFLELTMINIEISRDFSRKLGSNDSSNL